MTAKEFLLKIQHMNNRINNKLIRLETLKSVACNTSPHLSEDVVQRTREKSSLENIMVKVVDLSREIDNDIDAYNDYRVSVWEQLDRLYDERQKRILWLKYAERKTWNELSSILYISPRHIMRIHKQGLINLEKILKK